MDNSLMENFFDIMKNKISMDKNINTKCLIY